MAIGIQAYNIYGERIDFSTYNNVRFLGSVRTVNNGTSVVPSTAQETTKTQSTSFVIKNFDPTKHEIKYVFGPSVTYEQRARPVVIFDNGSSTFQGNLLDFTMSFDYPSVTVTSNTGNSQSATITSESVVVNNTAVNNVLTSACGFFSDVTFCKQVDDKFVYEEAVIYFYLVEK